MKTITNFFAGLMVSLFASVALGGPAMSVITVNTESPMQYTKWAMKHGKAIGASVDAMTGGTCVALTGYYQPGEVYYWHLFENHEKAIGANPYNKTVQKALTDLDVSRTVSQADAYSIVMAEPTAYAVGDTFANWNLIVSTDMPGVYLEQVSALANAAKSNGFEDTSLNVYSYLSGEHAGKMMVVAQAPNGDRLGAFIDSLSSEWAAPIMAKVGQIRNLERGFTMNCTVTYAK